MGRGHRDPDSRVHPEDYCAWGLPQPPEAALGLRKPLTQSAARIRAGSGEDFLELPS